MVNHQSQFPAVTVSFNLAPGASLGDAVNVVGGAAAAIGLPDDIQGSFQGTAQAFQASLSNQVWLVLAALMAVYIVLGVLYESYIHPITILSTLPSAGVGALLALLVTRMELTVIAIIGIILLIGIVKKNAIMMIDFALDAERRQGKAPREAIYEACLLRFRPILMTTMAALFGALPVAFAYGIGAELRRPLGVAIIGGLIVSQALTLFTTPVIYLTLDRLRRGGAAASVDAARSGAWRDDADGGGGRAGRCHVVRMRRGAAIREAAGRDAAGIQGGGGCGTGATGGDREEARGSRRIRVMTRTRVNGGACIEDAELDALLARIDVSNQNVKVVGSAARAGARAGASRAGPPRRRPSRSIRR